MSDFIDAINQAHGISPSSSSNNKKPADTLGKEDFLTLLVAQLENQDPLNPDDPTQFTAQLAQFSSLEQLTNLNDSMEALVNATNNSDRLSTLNTIGKEVAYHSGSFTYDGDQAVIGYKIDEPASEVSIRLVKDGVTASVLEGKGLAKGSHYLTWDGTTDSGDTALSGRYQIIVTAKDTSGTVIAASPIIRSEVTGVDLENGDTGTLETKAGSIAFGSILGVFEPGSFQQRSS